MIATIDRSIRPAHPMCNGLTWDGRYLWSNEFGDGRRHMISQLDPMTGRAIRSFPAPGYAGLTWDGSHLWHAYFAENTIYRLDPADVRVLHSFPTPRTGKPLAGPMGLAWDGSSLWTSDHVNTLFRLDPHDGRVVARFDVPGSRAHGMTWFRDHIWYAETDGRALYEVDPATGEVRRTVAVPDGTEPHGLTNDGECLWFSDTQKDPARDLIYRIRLP